MSFDLDLFRVLAGPGLYYLDRHFSVSLNISRSQYCLTVEHDEGGVYTVYADNRAQLLKQAKRALNLAACLKFSGAAIKVDTV